MEPPPFAQEGMLSSERSSIDLWQEAESKTKIADVWMPARQRPSRAVGEPVTPISVSKAWPADDVQSSSSPEKTKKDARDRFSRSAHGAASIRLSGEARYGWLDRDEQCPTSPSKSAKKNSENGSVSALGETSTSSLDEGSPLCGLKIEPMSPRPAPMLRSLPASVRVRPALHLRESEAERLVASEDSTRTVTPRLLRSREVGICRAASVSAGLWGVPIRASAQKHMSSDTSDGIRLVPVTLHVYDLTWLTKFLQLPVFHLGVEVYEREYSFGSTHSGVVSSKPLANDVHKTRHREAVPLGYTLLTSAEVRSVIKQLSLDWPASSYDVLSRNCVTFVVTLCRQLGVDRHIPPEYTRFAEFGCVSNCRAVTSCRNITPFPGEQDARDFEIANIYDVESDSKVSPQLRL